MLRFPVSCMVDGVKCGKLQNTDMLPCYQCVGAAILAMPSNLCPRCSDVLMGDQCVSEGCTAGLNRFSKVYAIGRLANGLQGGISRLKDAHVHCMKIPLGRLLAGYMLDRLEQFSAYSLFLPMPKHPERVAQRGLILWVISLRWQAAT